MASEAGAAVATVYEVTAYEPGWSARLGLFSTERKAIDFIRSAGFEFEDMCWARTGAVAVVECRRVQ
ncbi:MAG: hypothetical protein SOW20_03270 [Berryella intestinalis]|uniref:hypothetical protein n=1 Tax=Berryella intestinalis TaxID=1531429 RepID=UPI002A4EED06|nr:hypothetical protein [Berryella intestinalis]MDD7369533.1 hypothetical protein [Berryella intestinalis]MDY3129032.1 hypothetical protein [Berryella intestinalis]